MRKMRATSWDTGPETARRRRPVSIPKYMRARALKKYPRVLKRQTRKVKEPTGAAIRHRPAVRRKTLRSGHAPSV
jgi:hypothetical protein